ncbi:MAG: deoxyguanosinetriphosphate triphosphohydrolase [Eubacteriaceae bacterium]|nr:deoxyguanosinetriphosphate triphosphohydrolase [Eubacteriaceae bacterium]
MITGRELEQREYKILSKYATKSADSAGRDMPEEKCAMRTDFQRDRDRIVHSKAFRRLMHKTQVFLAPEGDHFRTRLTHTLEVSQIARTIARNLMLNEDLTEAISLGHDLGHTPFGHNGEKVLDEIYPGGFSHNRQSLRVVEVLEETHGRRGMNLTAEVRDGILNHTGPDRPYTPEGQIVKLSDRIAYINHDIDDAVRSGVITGDQLPAECIKYLGGDHRTRIDTLVRDTVVSSDGSSTILMSDEARKYMDRLREYMFENVYYNEDVKKASDLDKVEHMIKGLYSYYMEHPEELPGELRKMESEFTVEELVKDHIAGMTDRYAINMYEKLILK